MKELTLEASAKNIPTVTDFVNSELKVLGCSYPVLAQIDIAIDELFGNIANYAYKPNTGHVTVQVEVGEDPVSVIITFLDNGKAFNPLKQKDPDITLPAQRRKPGGLGIFMVRRTMDKVEYDYKDGKNILRIKKKL